MSIDAVNIGACREQIRAAGETCEFEGIKFLAVIDIQNEDGEGKRIELHCITGDLPRLPDYGNKVTTPIGTFSLEEINTHHGVLTSILT